MRRKLFLMLTSVLFFLAMLGGLFWLLQQPAIVHAADITVDITTDEDDSSCDLGDCSLREAVAAAASGDRIILGSDTYEITLGEIGITKSLTILGDGSASTIIDASSAVSPTRLFSITSGTVTFTAVSLTGGEAISTTGSDRGGAIWIGGLAGPTVILSQTEVISNLASTQGGGIYVGSGQLNLIDSGVLSNTAVEAGGGIYSQRGDIEITNSQVNFNEAPSGGGIVIQQEDASLTFNSGQINENTAASALPPSPPGGGLNVGAGTAQLIGGEIRHNTAYRGGGVYIQGGDVFLNGSEIVSNTATFGGGVYVHGAGGPATLTQTGGLITDNLATTLSGFGGGGLYVFQGKFVLEGGEVSNNRSQANGGGIEVADGTVVATGGLISGNVANEDGGGIFNDRAVITLTNLTMSNNMAELGGAIYASNEITVSTTISNSALITNSTSVGGDGGAIHNNAALTITNSTVSGNSADNTGGGIFNSATGTATLQNTTVYNNSAASAGGLNNSSGSLTIGNTILGGNSTPNCSGTITSAGYNLIEDCSLLSGPNDIIAAPDLGPLLLNQGSTMNHLPLDGSPAVDAADNISCPARDQRDFLRPVDGDGDTDPQCDIGAVETGIGYFISDASVTEGNSGTSAIVFVVTRSTLTGTTTVDFALSEGTAVADTDFEDISGTLSFESSHLTRTISVDVTGETIHEGDETFTVTLSNPSPSTALGDPTGVGTILNDDSPPEITIADAAINEGDGTATFTVSLSSASEQTISVDYSTNDDTAESPDDYSTISDTVTFTPGDTEESIMVTINDDTIDEDDGEVFTVDLTNPQVGTIGDDQAVGSITDNDDPPTLSVADVVAAEATGILRFTLTINESGKSVVVDYETQDNGSAVAGTDYTAASGSLTFDPGETSKTVEITLLEDDITESDETFLLLVSGDPADVQIPDSSAIGTIQDDVFIYLPIMTK